MGTVDFFGHRPATTHDYRRHFVGRWIAWKSELYSEKDGDQYDLLLPSRSARAVLRGCPPPVDAVCLTLVATVGAQVCMLLPPGSGKTTIALEISGLSVQLNPVFPVELRIAKRTPLQIFCSDMVWFSVVDGRLCLCRPKGEAMILAWDIARMLARRRIGIRRFEAERSLPISRRTQSAIFRRMFIQDPSAVISSKDICFPETLILVDGNWNARQLIQLDNNSKQSLLSETLVTQATHRSRFWTATPELSQRIGLIVKSIRIWPRILGLNPALASEALESLLSATLRQKRRPVR